MSVIYSNSCNANLESSLKFVTDSKLTLLDYLFENGLFDILRKYKFRTCYLLTISHSFEINPFGLFV